MLEGGANPVIEGSAVGGGAVDDCDASSQWVRQAIDIHLLPSNVSCRSVGHNLCGYASTCIPERCRVSGKMRELLVFAPHWLLKSEIARGRQRRERKLFLAGWLKEGRAK